MAVEIAKFARADKTFEEEYLIANRTADRLLTHLNSAEVLEKIRLANAPNASSALIQAVFEEFAGELGFKSECEGLFENYQNKALRPDYFMQLKKSGILLEVERGKTTINNMDLLDFWKCHLCEKANYLFLMVPRELRQNKKMSPRREFNTVKKRMSSFFEPNNYTNVYGLWLFGY